MKSIHKWCLSVAFGMALMCAPGQAFALTTVNMPSAGGTLTIGMVQNAAWAGFQPAAGGACTWFALGGAAGLSDNVRVVGTTGADTVFIFPNNTQQCNAFTFAPIKLNGFNINVAANSGDDLLTGKAAGFSGEAGNDTISGVGGFGINHWGGSGNDTMYGGGTEKASSSLPTCSTVAFAAPPATLKSIVATG